MSYTATKYLSPKAFAFPCGFDQTAKNTTIRGTLIENDTATEYSPGGIGSTAFEVTAFSSVGLVTYSNLLGLALVNGQRVVIFNTASNTNDGTYIVSQITPSSASAGTFVALPIPGKTLAGSSQTTQTAEGVGQLQFGEQQIINQTFTATAVAISGGVVTITYTTGVGPALQPGQKVTISGMTNAGNNGTFTLNAVFPTSSTAGSFQITNASAVASDSGTGTGTFSTGIDAVQSLLNPTQVNIFTSKGYVYVYDLTNLTIRIYVCASANSPLSEAAVGATVAFDGTLTFEAIFPRGIPA